MIWSPRNSAFLSSSAALPTADEKRPHNRAEWNLFSVGGPAQNPRSETRSGDVAGRLPATAFCDDCEPPRCRVFWTHSRLPAPHRLYCKRQTAAGDRHPRGRRHNSDGIPSCYAGGRFWEMWNPACRLCVALQETQRLVAGHSVPATRASCRRIGPPVGNSVRSEGRGLPGRKPPDAGPTVQRRVRSRVGLAVPNTLVRNCRRRSSRDGAAGASTEAGSWSQKSSAS